MVLRAEQEAALCLSGFIAYIWVFRYLISVFLALQNGE